MSTFQITLATKFVNNFSKAGRMKNRFYKMLGERGQNYIIQRNLKDGSSVILGYYNKKVKYAAHAVKVNADGTSVYKRELVYNIPSPKIAKDVKSKGTRVEKFVLDKNGKKTGTAEILDSKRDNGHVFSMDKLNWKKGVFMRAEHYREVPDTGNDGSIPIKDSIKRIINKYFPGRTYNYIENVNGTKTFSKNIEGIKYSFTTEK